MSALFDKLTAMQEETKQEAAPAPAAQPEPQPDKGVNPPKPDESSAAQGAAQSGLFDSSASTKPAETPAPAAQPDPTPAAEPQPEQTGGVEPLLAHAGKPTFVLLLDCIYMKNQTQMNGVYALTDLIKPLEDAVAKENQVPHWGCVDFAKGGPQLASKLDRFLTQHASKGGVIVADGSTPSCRACKDVLYRHAAVIIQGVR